MSAHDALAQPQSGSQIGYDASIGLSYGSRIKDGLTGHSINAHYIFPSNKRNFWEIAGHYYRFKEITEFLTGPVDFLSQRFEIIGKRGLILVKAPAFTLQLNPSATLFYRRATNTSTFADPVTVLSSNQYGMALGLEIRPMVYFNNGISVFTALSFNYLQIYHSETDELGSEKQTELVTGAFDDRPFLTVGMMYNLGSK